jgi:hypothetical protein
MNIYTGCNTDVDEGHHTDRMRVCAKRNKPPESRVAAKTLRGSGARWVVVVVAKPAFAFSS